ncbi:hypothetical protein AMQ83_29195 [Paenibacillus riograndensis]|nr:hypothetical protein AMQ83_29195 [Paenibacillus riograndensis]
MEAKLLLCFLVIALLPLAVMGYFSTHKSSKIVNDQFGSYGMNAIEELKLHLDTSIAQMDNITGNLLNYLISTPMVIEEVETPSYGRYQEEQALQRYLVSFETVNIVSVSVITPSGKIIGSGALDPERLAESTFWGGITAGGGREVVIHSPDYYYSFVEDKTVISLVVPVKDHFGLPPGSRILIDTRADAVVDLLRAFQHNMNARLQIRAADGTVLLQGSEENAGSADDVVWSGIMEREGWTVEARMPRGEFYRSSGVILKYTLLVGGSALICAVLMAHLFSLRLTRPIQKLTQSMRRFGQGELFIQTPVLATDELGYLSRSFNRMTGQIQELVREISRTEKLKSEAELRALHYQINPHLLFNTLNSIQWKARLAGRRDIQKMIEHLVVVLDSSLSVSRTLVPLQDELDVSLHFIEIQRFRYDGAFSFIMEADPELMSCLVPRMVFQPLLENIFFHGFTDGAGEITLSLAPEADGIKAVLTDNGIGVKPEHLQYVKEGQVIPGKKGGLGLRNVMERFKMHFGDACMFTVESERNHGTKVTILWPKTYGETAP